MSCSFQNSNRIAVIGRVCIAATFLVMAPSERLLAQDAASALPLSVPVKVLQAQDVDTPSDDQAPMLAPQRPQPTLPSGRLPQYQLGESESVFALSTELQNPKLRFVVALPSRPILVEAVVTIDGAPFATPRENRIDEIFKSVTATSVAPQAPAAPSSEAVATATPNDTKDSEARAEPDAKTDGDPPVVPRYAFANSAAEFVRRYFVATNRSPSRAEIRWLMTDRVEGPVVLLLNDTFQRFRAAQRPMFHVLDRDRDGTIYSEELQQAVASLQACDLNRDEIVDYVEIAQAADDRRRKNTEPFSATKLIQSPVDTAATPEVTLTVSFNTSQAAASTLAVTAANTITQAVVHGETITLAFDDAILAFSAVQSGGGDQISLGAVNDGYPLLPVLDPNDDGRFTVRELRELDVRLGRFDRNHDGKLTADETPPTIRVCFGLGPLVHRELAEIRSVNPSSPTEAVQAPAWFARMDRNIDHDLTRNEFPGSDEQFQTLDSDHDGLVSAREASDFERNAQPSTEAHPESK
jgi:Ca2+-binding EF-hand superfamily protein